MRKKHWIYARSASEYDNDGDEDDDEEADIALLAYNVYMKEAIISIIKKAYPSYNIENNMKNISRVIQVTVDISKNIYKFIDMAENASKIEDRDGNLSDLVYIKIKDLQKLVDDEMSNDGRKNLKIFEKYIKLILNGIPEAHFDIDSDIVLTSNADIMYLKNAIKLIYETKTIDLEAYLW